MHLLSKLIILAVLAGTSINISAQGVIRGFVKAAATGQPVMFILVGLEGTSMGVRTDENGFYSLTKIPNGDYTLIISSLEFKEVREAVTITKDKVFAKNFLLEKNDVILGEIEISAKGQ